MQFQEPWPEATLPRYAGVMVVPSLRRPASRCRGSWRPPAGAQLHLHTCVKGSAQAVKPDVCRCAAFEKKVISSSAISTKISQDSPKLQILAEIQNMMTEIKCEPEQVQGRILFMSMHNDIVWERKKGNKELCVANSLNVAEKARGFAPGH